MSERFWTAGTYRAKVTQIELVETNNGHDAILVYILPLAAVTDGGELPVDPSPYSQKIWLMSHTDKTRGYTLRKLRGAGWEGSQFQTLAGDMDGVVITVEATDDSYNDRLTTRWDLPLPTAKPRPVKAQALNAAFADLLKAEKTGTPPAKKQTRRKPAPPDDEQPVPVAPIETPGDEIPF